MSEITLPGRPQTQPETPPPTIPAVESATPPVQVSQAPPPQDGGDMAGAFMKGREDSELDRLMQEAQANIQAQEQAGVIPKTEADDFNKKQVDQVNAVGKDIIRGVVESPKQVIGGIRDTVQNTLFALDDLAGWIYQNSGLMDAENAVREAVGAQPVTGEERVVPTLPKVDEAKSVTGNLVRKTSQFVSGFIPALKAMRGLTAATTAAGMSAEALAAGAAADALVFDPHEKRLSNLIEEFPALSNPVTGYLQAKPEDSDAEGRFKNAVEGLGLGALTDGFTQAVKAIRANRIEKGLAPKAKLAIPEDGIIKQLGEPKGKLVDVPADSADMLARFAKGETGDLPFQMNWSKFTGSEDIDKAVNTVARMFKGQIDEARRGTIPDKELAEMARRLNMTPQELLARNGGEAFNAERILASKAILEASSEKLVDLARVAQSSTDDADLLAFRKMIDIHAGLQKQFQGAASEAGRALRALQLPVGSKEKQLRDLQGLLMADGGPDAIRSMANAISQINDPAQIDRIVRGSLGKRMSDAVVEAWYFALLSGPQTHAVNVATSGLNTVWNIPERALAAQVARLRGAPAGVQVGEATEMFHGMVGSMGDALKASAKALREGEGTDIFGKVEARSFKAISSESFGIRGAEGSAAWFYNKALDGLGTFFRLPTRFLMAEDEFYRTVGKSMQLRSLALRQARSEGLEGAAMSSRIADLLRNPTEEMMESALDFTRSLTFTNPLGAGGSAIQRGLNKFPASKFVAPFIRTPVNIMKHVGMRSPLAPLAQSFREAIARGGPEADLAISRMALGSTLMLVAADASLNGQISGSGPTDPDLRRIWRDTHQPNSIKIGDTWYSYNRADPFGMMLGIAADYAMIAGQIGEEDADKLITGAAIATSKNVFSKTWMRGPAELVEALNDPERFGDRFVQRFLGTLLVPTGAAQVARTMDPVWRDVQSTMDSIRSRTPGFSDTLPPRRNLWGEKIIGEGGLGPDIISPVYTESVKKSPISDYMVENRIEVSMPARVQMGAELTPQEYSRFVELAGNGLKEPASGMGAKETLDAILSGNHPLSSQWQSATDGPEGGRALIVKSVIQGFRQAAQAKLLEEYPDLRMRVEARAMERGQALQETIRLPERGRLP